MAKQLSWVSTNLVNELSIFHNLITFIHLQQYVTETFRTDNILNPEYHRFFRVVPAAQVSTSLSPIFHWKMNFIITLLESHCALYKPLLPTFSVSSQVRLWSAPHEKIRWDLDETASRLSMYFNSWSYSHSWWVHIDGFQLFWFRVLKRFHWCEISRHIILERITLIWLH